MSRGTGDPGRLVFPEVTAPLSPAGGGHRPHGHPQPRQRLAVEKHAGGLSPCWLLCRRHEALGSCLSTLTSLGVLFHTVSSHLSGRNTASSAWIPAQGWAHPCKSRSEFADVSAWSLAAAPVPLSPCPSVPRLPSPSKVNRLLLLRGLSRLRSGHPPSATCVSSFANLNRVPFAGTGTPREAGGGFQGIRKRGHSLRASVSVSLLPLQPSGFWVHTGQAAPCPQADSALQLQTDRFRSGFATVATPSCPHRGKPGGAN